MMSSSPVRGFRPLREALFRTVNTPKLKMLTGSPCWRVDLNNSSTQFSSEAASCSEISASWCMRWAISIFRIWSYFPFGRETLVHRKPLDLSVNDALVIDDPVKIGLLFRPAGIVSWERSRGPQSIVIERVHRLESGSWILSSINSKRDRSLAFLRLLRPSSSDRKQRVKCCVYSKPDSADYSFLMAMARDHSMHTHMCRFHFTSKYIE